MEIIGLDIGGANLKAATASGRAVSRRFEIWRAPEKLSSELRTLLADLPSAQSMAVTMTAELADCFETKSQGVAFILQAVQDVAGSTSVHVWETAGRFLSPQVAVREPMRVAAANWHVLATWIGRHFQVRRGMLIDIGSTTADLVPLRDCLPAAIGLTDVQRLQSGELVYSGVRRTPLCAVSAAAPFRGDWPPLAAEWFATTLDIYLMLGKIAEDDQDLQTADGRPATVVAARDRLARTLCCDRTELTDDEVQTVARFLADAQLQTLSSALDRVWQRQSAPCDVAVISGAGSFLARRLVRNNEHTRNCQLIELSELFRPQVADSACAFAAACLLHESL